MQFIWTESDLKVGRVICREPESTQHPINWGYVASTTSKMGFTVGSGKGKEYRLIALTDGMVTNAMTAEEVVKSLNDGNYRPMPNDWLLKVVEHTRYQNEATSL